MGVKMKEPHIKSIWLIFYYNNYKSVASRIKIAQTNP